MNHHILIRPYQKGELKQVIDFLTACLPESGRAFDLTGADNAISNLEQVYTYFLCAIDKETGELVGTCAYKAMEQNRCELKCVYLYQKYYGQGIGAKMCRMVMDKAREDGYQEMYLDTISTTSGRAIRLYRHLGFEDTSAYHKAARSDLFMKCHL